VILEIAYEEETQSGLITGDIIEDILFVPRRLRNGDY